MPSPSTSGPPNRRKRPVSIAAGSVVSGTAHSDFNQAHGPLSVGLAALLRAARFSLSQSGYFSFAFPSYGSKYSSKLRHRLRA